MSFMEQTTENNCEGSELHGTYYVHGYRIGGISLNTKNLHTVSMMLLQSLSWVTATLA